MVLYNARLQGDLAKYTSALDWWR